MTFIIQNPMIAADWDSSKGLTIIWDIATGGSIIWLLYAVSKVGKSKESKKDVKVV
jgi:hypothetical protein